jgi:hypothetical protein
MIILFYKKSRNFGRENHPRASIHSVWIHPDEENIHERVYTVGVYTIRKKVSIHERVYTV